MTEASTFSLHACYIVYPMLTQACNKPLPSALACLLTVEQTQLRTIPTNRGINSKWTRCSTCAYKSTASLLAWQLHMGLLDAIRGPRLSALPAGSMSRSMLSKVLPSGPGEPGWAPSWGPKLPGVKPSCPRSRLPAAVAVALPVQV
jgi:hypothetical protein